MDEVQMVVFVLENEEYALEISNVQEIIRLLKVTRVPNGPESVSSVINLRGNVIPVMDLRNRLGYSPGIETDDTRIIVTGLEGKKMGLVVDNVLEVLTLEPEFVEPPPVVTDKVKLEFIKGVGKSNDRLLIMLDLKKVTEI